MHVVHNDGYWWVWSGVFPIHDGLQDVRLEPGVPVKAKLDSGWAAMQGDLLQRVVDPTLPEEEKPRKVRAAKVE